MPLKWWRGGIPSWAFGGVDLVGLFVLFGGLFAWFSCFDVRFLCLMLSGIFGFWWEGFLLVWYFCWISSLVCNCEVRNKKKSLRIALAKECYLLMF